MTGSRVPTGMAKSFGFRLALKFVAKNSLLSSFALHNNITLILQYWVIAACTS